MDRHQQGEPSSPSGPVVLISGCKGEARTLRSGYKQLARHLKAARCEVRRLEGAAGVTRAALAGAAILVLGGPTQPFSAAELKALRDYLREGGNLLVLGGEGGSGGSVASGGGAGTAAGAASTSGTAAGPGTNLNCMLEEYGLSLASDCVIQTAFSRYTHPKQVLVSDGILSPDMATYCSSNSRQARRQGAGEGAGAPARGAADENGRPHASFAYPHGSTVLAQAPAVAFLSSGQTAHPCNMTVGAAWWQDGDPSGSVIGGSDSGRSGQGGSGGSAGRLAVLGSAAMFDDDWLGKEDNTPLLDFLLGWMLKDPACSLSARSMAEPEIVDARPVTHVAELAAQPRVCLQEHPELPRDITRLFADSLFKLDLSFLPQVAALRRRLLGGSHSSGSGGGPSSGGQLALWRPTLEVPFPPLAPAVFPPPLWELPPPALELFDLDEDFAGPLDRLSAITARFLAAPRAHGGSSSGSQQQQQQQLAAYIGECAQLLGLRSSGQGGGAGGAAAAKEQLAEVLEAVVLCKTDAY